MLQRRGSVTAANVAAELEVSERTARRDLEALGAAGMPVYSQQGRGGGWRLLGHGTTDLSGLSAAEVRALFLVAGPAAAATKDVKAALRKLVRALPEPFRDQAEAASAAIVIDPAGWNGSSPNRPTPPLLDEVQDAVVGSRQINLVYRAGDGAESTRTAHPLGLAAKGTAWYLIANTEAGMRSFRVDRIRAIEVLGQPAVRPEGFDLAAVWADIATSVSKRHQGVSARVKTSREGSRIMRSLFGARVSISRGVKRDGTAEDDFVEVDVAGNSLSILARELAGFGSMVEVLSPREIRVELARIGAQLTDLYFGECPPVP